MFDTALSVKLWNRPGSGAFPVRSALPMSVSLNLLLAQNRATRINSTEGHVSCERDMHGRRSAAHSTKRQLHGTDVEKYWGTQEAPSRRFGLASQVTILLTWPLG